MLQTEWIITLATIAWAVIILLYQWITARGDGRKDYSAKAGNSLQGIIYNFTWAMAPSHKETIRLHPFEFLVGVIMHIGAFAAIAKVIVLLFKPEMKLFSTSMAVYLFAPPILCAVFLFLKRLSSREMRIMSSPDDYISVLLTLDIILAALLHELGVITPAAFMLLAALLFFYLPLGKLRHAFFFFVARADYGSRLGYRGTYPVKKSAGE